MATAPTPPPVQATQHAPTKPTCTSSAAETTTTTDWTTCGDWTSKTKSGNSSANTKLNTVVNTQSGVKDTPPCCITGTYSYLVVFMKQRGSLTTVSRLIWSLWNGACFSVTPTMICRLHRLSRVIRVRSREGIHLMQLVVLIHLKLSWISLRLRSRRLRSLNLLILTKKKFNMKLN